MLNKYLYVFAIILTVALIQTNCNSVKIGSSLLSKMIRGENCNIVIRIVNGTDHILKELNEKPYKTRSERLNTVYSTLKNYAKDCHAFILPFLETLDYEYKSFWISNEIFVAKASPELVTILSRSKSIAEIAEERIIELDDPIDFEIQTEVAVRDPDPQEGIKLIQAPSAWQKHNVTGEGVLVGTIDTGVRWTHEALRAGFVGGDHAWFDPGFGTKIPDDRAGHGTHTMGTIVGRLGIGVAPGANWMACRGCRDNSCSQSDLLDCAQFIQCPTKYDGTDAKCEKAPHLVSNSWGAGQGQTFFDDVIGSWKAAGIVPIFSVGNSGPGCGTANSPADSKSGPIAVGATDFDDSLADFSSVGPSLLKKIKPDICGPGVNIQSAWYQRDNQYVTISGTSMACPHVSGVIALLKSQNLNMKFAEVESILFSTAEKTGLKIIEQKCGDVDEKKFPNNACGHGRLNALGAVEKLLMAKKS